MSVSCFAGLFQASLYSMNAASVCYSGWVCLGFDGHSLAPLNDPCPYVLKEWWIQSASVSTGNLLTDLKCQGGGEKEDLTLPQIFLKGVWALLVPIHRLLLCSTESSPYTQKRVLSPSILWQCSSPTTGYSPDSVPNFLCDLEPIISISQVLIFSCGKWKKE